MQQTMMAIPQEAKVRPAFTVKKLSGTYEKLTHYFHKDSNRIMIKREQRPCGYLVTFAKGHSIHAVDEDHLKRIGADVRLVPLINDDSGEVVGSVENQLEAA